MNFRHALIASLALCCLALPAAAMDDTRDNGQSETVQTEPQCFALQGGSSNTLASRLNCNIATASFPGVSGTPIRPFGECVYIDNSSERTYFVPLATAMEWGEFKKHPPQGVSFRSCVETEEPPPTVTPPTEECIFGCDKGYALGNVYKLKGWDTASCVNSTSGCWGYGVAEETVPNDICTRSIVTTVESKTINVPNRDFRRGFPHVPNLVEGFVIDYNGAITAEQEGDYTFYVNADDAAILKVDGRLLVNMNRIQGQRAAYATIHLTKGDHDFRLIYAQMPRYFIALEFHWRTPGSGIFKPVPLKKRATTPVCEPIY
ncbi:MAG: hypothetical protein GC131_08875 [Alphaproteobacteria bacterium]|nr:hypothetical protein [Alphaproteobacteria bacterium]